MRNALIIAFLGICMISIGHCDRFSGDLNISDSSIHEYEGLTVGRNLVISGSGPVTVFGDATIERNLDYHGSGSFHVTGTLTVRGRLTTTGSGNFKADGGIIN